MHVLRRGVLLCGAVALVHGRRLTLVNLARAGPGAERIRAPLKALDWLLGNTRLNIECRRIYSVMTRWLVCNKRPVIGVDWRDLKANPS
ncbi:MAG: IS4 family transposase, partial [Dokdonella sp.]